MKRLAIGILLIWIVTTTNDLLAQRPARIPAYPGPIERVQPDGDTILVRLYGDEHGHYMTTIDHYLVIENEKGYICYAREIKNSRIVATKKIAHDANKRSRCEKKYLLKKGILKSKK